MRNEITEEQNFHPYAVLLLAPGRIELQPGNKWILFLIFKMGIKEKVKYTSYLLLRPLSVMCMAFKCGIAGFHNSV